MSFLVLISLAMGLLLYSFRLNDIGRKTISVLVSIGLLALLIELGRSGLPKDLSVGMWPHYAGIHWYLDPLSFVFCLSLAASFPAIVFRIAETHELHLSLIFFLTGALFAAFMTGDIFNLYVFFEVFLVASYIVFFKSTPLQAARPFIWLNILGSFIFLTAIACLYRELGTLNFADIAVRFDQLTPAHQDLLFFLFTFAFGLKAGIFPIFAWMPLSYPILPTSIIAFVASFSTKLGLYSFLRLMTLFGSTVLARHFWFLSILGILSAFVPLVMMAPNRGLKRALIYFSLSHSGLLFLASVGILQNAFGLASILLLVLGDALLTSLVFLMLENENLNERGHKRFNHFGKYIFGFALLSAAGFPALVNFFGDWLMLQSFQTWPILFLITLAYFLICILIAIKILLMSSNFRATVGISEIYLALACLIFIVVNMSYGNSWVVEMSSFSSNRMNLIQSFQQDSRNTDRERRP